MVLDILHMLGAEYQKQTGVKKLDTESCLIALTVLMGHCEGKPFNATKLAAYLGLPRTTVLRRLSILTRCGLVTRNHRGYLIEPSMIDRRDVLLMHGRLVRLIKSTAAQLSDLDTQLLDSMSPAA